MKRITITYIFSVSVTALIAQSSARNYVKSITYLNSNGSGCITNVQYYDGLGRPDVSLTGGVNTSGKYLYSFKTYDEFGRAETIWSPVVGGTTPDYKSLSEIKSISQNLYSDNYGYSATTYDALSRPTFVSTPGSAWVGKGKSITYGTNSANEVKKYNLNSMPNFAYYSKNTLVCTQIKDEDGHSIKTYKDVFGNLVLERRIDGDTNFDTYYVYNSLNQLVYVLQPMFQKEDDLGKFAFHYTYDERGRMKTKVIPGCEPLKYWYDNADRLIKMQDGVMAINDEYRTYEYDELGRMVAQYLIFDDGWDYEVEEVEVLNFYDTYDFLDNYSYLLPCDIDLFYPLDEDYGVGMLTGTYQTASNGDELLTSYGYDLKGRIERKTDLTLDLHVSQRSYAYNFLDQVTTEWINEYDRVGTSDYIDETLWGWIENIYSSRDNNLLSASVLHTYNDVGAIYQVDTIASYKYDDFGHIISNNRDGSNADMTYKYDLLHGWMTQIASACGFEQNLYRETGPGTARYNGSLSAMTWKTSSDYLRKFEYVYDGINRLKKAKYGYYKLGSSSISSELSSLVAVSSNYRNEDFTTYYTYDKNSNITGLTREGYCPEYGYYDTVDDIDISYNGNQRMAASDNYTLSENGAADFVDGTDDEEEYTYDKNGNLEWDGNKGMSYIYDMFNHPYEVIGGKVRIQYVYAPDGRKLRATHNLYSNTSKNSSSLISSTTTDYNGDAIYKNGVINRFNFAGGYISFKTNGNRDKLHYYIQDYQGNNRMTVSTKDIEQITHYYPYGNEINLVTDKGRNFQDYKFGNKELDNFGGLDFHDFHARQYDATVPAFTSIDPLAEKYYGISPYAYCAGDPVNCIDPTGMSYKTDTVGKVTYEDDEYKKTRLVAYDGSTKKLNEGQAEILDSLMTSQVKGEMDDDGNPVAYAQTTKLARKNVLSLFRFLAKHTTSEWGVISFFGINGKPASYSLATSHHKTHCFVPYKEQWNRVRFAIHSHPTPGSQPSTHDINSAHSMVQAVGASPLFGIYYPKTDEFLKYKSNDQPYYYNANSPRDYIPNLDDFCEIFDYLYK